MLRQFFSLGNKIESQTIGANEHIVNQLHSLEVERDILTKTISRLYDNDSDLNKIQRDKLLLRYQHQLCLLYTSPSPRDKRQYRMASSA